MTYTEAYTHIDNLLDKAGTAYFTDTEKNNFLDLAVMEYTKGLINTLESDAQSMEKIAPLVANSNNQINNSGSVTLPTNFYHLLSANTATSKSLIDVMGINQYNAAKHDPFHSATATNPIGLLKGSILEVLGSTENVDFVYVENPKLADEEVDITAGTDLVGGYNLNSSEEIVNIAVRKMMLSLEDPRYQLQVNELSAEKR